MPVLKGEGPSSFLSSLILVFLTNFIVLTFLDISSLGYGNFLHNNSFNFLYNYELWSLCIFEYSIVALFPYSPAKV